jgi:HEAT repeat protein
MAFSDPADSVRSTTKSAERRANLNSTLVALQDPARPVAGIDLDVLSDLAAADLGRFQTTWLALSRDRRRTVLSNLVEIAEDHVDAYFDPILLWLVGDEDPVVRARAIEGLWEDEDARLIAPLIRRLTDDNAPEVRAVAATALGRFVLMGELDELDPTIAARVERVLLDAFSGAETDVLVRRRALESLAYSSQEHVQELILEAYEDDDDSLRLSAVFAMGRSADLRWKDTVVEELGSTETAMCFEAARACGELELAEAVPYLVGLVREDDVDVRDAAVWALGRIGGPQARRALQACLASDDEDLVEAAEDALAEIDFMAGEEGPPAFFLEP